MNVLLLGSGGREHALAHALKKSTLLTTLYIAPGNAGMSQEGKLVQLDILNTEEILAFAKKHSVDLVVVGPEAPLVNGIADVLRNHGILCFGPSKQGAQLEGSKKYAKEFMQEFNIPTAAYGSFKSAESAHEFIDTHTGAIVVKADGLAAGKGVYVCENISQAHEAVDEIFSGKFGLAGNEIIIEEYLEGRECSFLVLRDASGICPLPLSQDHKKIGEGDTGPNTGGMGVYSPSMVSDEEYEAMLAIAEQTHQGLLDKEIDFRGVIYLGFMLTSQGPKVLEYNARFGDPETQALLPRISSDVLEMLLSCAQNQLSSYDLEISKQSSFCVILASQGYPGSYEKGKQIYGLNKLSELTNVYAYHAGTAMQDGKLVTNGGRVLAVTALGDNLKEASTDAYNAISLIDFEGMYYRRDIGYQAL